MTYSRKYRDMMRPMDGVARKLPDWAPVFNDEMADYWYGEVVWNAPLAEYTTFKVGGAAEAVIFPRGLNELSLLIQGLRKINVPWRVLGRGSNVVVADEGLSGVVFVFGDDFAAIEVVGEEDTSVLIRVDAGCSLARLVNWAAARGLGGLEFASGIPGSVGGAIVMNAGAWNREMKDVLAGVTIMNDRGCVCMTRAEDMHFSYRCWGEEEGKIALQGFFRLTRKEADKVTARCREYRQLRRERQPRNMASGGSFFKNPGQGKAAGQLIDEAGLKGYAVGGAKVSEVHANFIVNTGGATAGDIVELMHIIQDRVREEFGIQLEPEVKILG